MMLSIHEDKTKSNKCSKYSHARSNQVSPFSKLFEDANKHGSTIYVGSDPPSFHYCDFMHLQMFFKIFKNQINAMCSTWGPIQTLIFLH
ncbi:hypothetical protein Fmac_006873 [Flemingia macrophylla]|uniref:Uncharacterized protein n=1 Tax=Flemingia macrophylla TaxID=520843 RepID=A0ABD1NDD1_9FABA